MDSTRPLKVLYRLGGRSGLRFFFARKSDKIKMQMMFTGMWRVALGIETLVLLAATIFAVVSTPPTWPIAILLTMSWMVALAAWAKYWRMEQLLGVPGLFLLGL
jgi:hypothetical protein